MPQVGDVIIEHTDRHGLEYFRAQKNQGYFGIVTDIHLDKYGHQRSVMIEWAESKPPEYNDAWGYCGVNIHNLYNRFSVIRNGTEV